MINFIIVPSISVSSMANDGDSVFVGQQLFVCFVENLQRLLVPS